MFIHHDNNIVFISQKGVIKMDIPALSMAMSQHQTMTTVNIALLSKNLDQSKNNGDQLAKMMAQSIQPHLGAHVDLTL